jgi:hypothetical protein
MAKFSVKKYSLAFGFIILCLASCKKFIEIDNPKDQIISSSVFSNEASANSAIAGVYSEMMNSGYFFANGGITIAAGLSSDEIFSRISGDETRFYQNSLTASDNFIVGTRLWTAAYKTIYHANALIEGLKSSTLPTKLQLEGEAKFLRAFHYFYLVNLFGDVPLIVSTDYVTNSILPRSPSSKVYEQIISDLKDAQALMSATYPSAERLRPNKLTATLLLSRTYLFLKDWKNGEAEANQVINSGLFTIEKDLDKVFLPKSNETIWQLLPVSGSKTPIEAQAFLPATLSTGRPLYPLNPIVISYFETGDQRKIKWVQDKIVSGTTYSYTTKYKTKVVTSDPLEYNVAFRLAEAYLIRAEARAEQSDIAGSQADLNIIRKRAGLEDTKATDKASLLAAIQKEKNIEFLNEWGHRWFDIKRWGIADNILSTIKAPNWQSTDMLYPIPQIEMDRNSFLEQNPGY